MGGAGDQGRCAAFGSPDGEIEVGAVLEGARAEKGLTLDEAESATKIRKRYLAGLEREDYSVMPDAVCARGFLKTYANFLGLDGDGLSRRLRNRRKPLGERGLNHSAPNRSAFEDPLVPPGGVTGSERRKVSKTTVIALVVSLLVVVGVLGALYRVGQNAQNPENPEGAGAARTAVGEAARPEAAPVAGAEVRDVRRAGVAPSGVPGGLRVEVSVEGAPSWVRVRADGSTVFEDVVGPGFSRTFEAEREVNIKAGDAGAVSATVNGQDLGSLGGGGEVLGRSFTLKEEV